MKNIRTIDLGLWSMPGGKTVRATLEIDVEKAGLLLPRALHNKSGTTTLGHGMFEIAVREENTPG